MCLVRHSLLYHLACNTTVEAAFRTVSSGARRRPVLKSVPLCMLSNQMQAAVLP